MTNPKHAHDTSNGRYYTDPSGGPDLISVTNVLDASVNKARSLMPWAVKLTVEWVLDNIAEVARLILTDRETLTRSLKEIHRTAGETAKDLGTLIHQAAEQRLLGAPVPQDPVTAPYLAQLDQFLDYWDVDLEQHVHAAEITCMHRSLGYAGTADAMIWLPTGPDRARELWLIDFKTSATRSVKSVYPEHELQLAALRYCETVLLPDDTDQPMPEIHRTGVLNLRTKSHALVEMPAGRAAHRAFRGGLINAQWQHAAPSSYPALLAPDQPVPARWKNYKKVA